MDKRVLLVDDEANILSFLDQLFTNNDYDVLTASDGEEAYKLFQKNAVQIVVTDLKMPNMGGIELCRKVKIERPTACVIGMTGYYNIFDLVTCREAGFEDFFVKPVKATELLDAVNSIYHKICRWRKTS
jgi:DNA-binding response OmpR family regulator